MNKTLNEISKEVYEANKLKGFDAKECNTGQTLMLIVSELSEALEADRKGRRVDINATKNLTNGYTISGNLSVYIKQGKTEKFIELFKEKVKDTFEDEIADALIRLFDLVGALEINIDRHIELKRQFNATREYKHGKKY